MSANGLGDALGTGRQAGEPAGGRQPHDQLATAHWDLPAETGSAALARALTGEALRQWHIHDQADVDDIVLMVDELVTNAIVHGRGPVRLALRLDGARLTAEVGDDSPVTPAPPGPRPDILEWAEDGRGLQLVGALASAFGTRPDPRGKTVWFTRTLHTPNGTRPAPGRTGPARTDRTEHTGNESTRH